MVDGDVVTVGNLEFNVLFTPGYVALTRIEPHACVFVHDTIYMYVFGVIQSQAKLMVVVQHSFLNINAIIMSCCAVPCFAALPCLCTVRVLVQACTGTCLLPLRGA